MQPEAWEGSHLPALRMRAYSIIPSGRANGCVIRVTGRGGTTTSSRSSLHFLADVTPVTWVPGNASKRRDRLRFAVGESARLALLNQFVAAMSAHEPWREQGVATG
jgi:hypothetical protein